MHCVTNIHEDLYWVGASDRRLAKFENVFPIPRGVSYNAYLVLDEKTVLLDTCLLYTSKVAANVSAFAQGTAMLTLSEETRPMQGGFILKNGRIEVNCTFDAMIRSEREQTAGAVAKLLFPET